MTNILIFMIASLFLYTFSLRLHNIVKCPRCHSYKINIEKSIDHTVFRCQTCKFSYKDYYSFLTLTPINDQFDLDFKPLDDEHDSDIDDT